MEYYRARLSAGEEGLEVYFQIYKAVHETKDYHFCVDAFMYYRAKNLVKMHPGVNPATLLKQSGVKVHRVGKEFSRIAKPTKEAAIENLLYRTRRRIKHMERDLDFCREFIASKDNLHTTHENENQVVMLAKGTQEVVNKHYPVWL